MLLSITCCRATTDGSHIKDFLHGLYERMDEPNMWIIFQV